MAKPLRDPSQTSLFPLTETPDRFRKAVEVVHSRSLTMTPLTLLQRKVGNAWLKHCHLNKPIQPGWWEMSISELAIEVGFENSHNTVYLKTVARALMTVMFEWDVLSKKSGDKKKQWEASILFPNVKINENFIRFEINSEIRDQVTNPEVYALIDMRVMRRFRRASSLVIWEMCVRYEGVGQTPKIPWENMRDMILGLSVDPKKGVAEGKQTYQEYKYFKAKILKPAREEINAESEHHIEILEERIGKRISTVQFKVTRKELPEDQQPKVDELDAIIAQMVAINVPKSEATRLAKRHTIEQVTQALDYTRKRIDDPNLPRVKRPAAYFRQALQNEYAKSVEDSKKNGGSSKGERKPKRDIRAEFDIAQSKQAEAYYTELEYADQNELVERYNAQQKLTALRVKKNYTPSAKSAFFGWLAIETWGEPTQEDLLHFVAGLLNESAQ
jgi:plasmid replication initiation protein